MNVAIPGNAQVQSNYFSNLSHTHYAEKIAEAKLRVPAKTYPEKEQQKYYESIVKLRNESLVEDLEKDRIVYDTFLLGKCNSIIKRIKQSNPGYDYTAIQPYIYRSNVPNAASLGDGSLYVNLGLFLWVDNDDELALILGHELSHYFQKHFEKRIDNNIMLLSSEEFKEEMKSIKKSSDGKYLRFRKLLKEISSKGGTHSRFKETEADSLGVALIRNAGYNVASAAKVLLKLDYSDDLSTKPNLYTLATVFQNQVSELYLTPKKKKYNGLSQQEVTMNSDADFDSVKTHPDCALRYKAISSNNTYQVPECCTSINDLNHDVKKRALVELVRNFAESADYTRCIHYCIIALQSGYADDYFRGNMALAFAGIAAADRKMVRFSATHAGAKAGSSLKELQEFIFRLPREEILSICDVRLAANVQNSEDYDFALMKYRIELKPEQETVLVAAFKRIHPTSKYNYLLK